MFFNYVFVVIFLIVLVPIKGITNGFREAAYFSYSEFIDFGSCTRPTRDFKCPSEVCIDIDDVCDGWNDCTDNADELPSLCANWTDDVSKFQCLNGKFIDLYNVCDGIEDCRDGSDESVETCEQSGWDCDRPDEKTIRFQCEFKGVPIPCDKSVKAFTTLKIFCNIGYVPDPETKWVSTNKCRKTGKWLHQIKDCTYDCGTSDNEIYPWNVVIYKRTTGGYKRHCHGTLITPFYIITDYNCAFIENGDDLNAEDIKIGLTSPLLTFVQQDDANRLANVRRIIKEDYFQPQKTMFWYRKYVPPKRIPVISYEQMNSTQLYGNVTESLIESTTIPLKTTSTSDAITFDIRSRQSQPPEGKEGYINIKYKSILLELSSHIDLNEYKPVCFDIDGKLDISSFSKGIVFGEKENDTFNLVDEVRILMHEECQLYINEHWIENVTTNGKLAYDEICIIYDPHIPEIAYGVEELVVLEDDYEDEEKNNIIDIFVGTGLTVNIKETHYLIGVFTRTVTVKKEKKKSLIKVFIFNDVAAGTPVPDQPGFFINIAVDKIRIKPSENWYWHYSRKATICSVPYTFGAMYTAEPCVPGRPCSELAAYKPMDQYAVIFMYCKQNFTLQGQCNYKVCLHGNWEPENITCVRTCEPLVTALTVKTECSYKEKIVSCKETIMAETIGTSICETGGLKKDLMTYNNTCLHNGNWRDSPEVVEILCIDLCGILKSERPLIQNGEEANSTFHPWNAALFYEYKEGHYTTICGGTLISKYAVLSAAHCIENQFQERLQAKQIKIGLGKYFRQFNHPEDLQAQYKDVENIFVPNLYDGPPSAFVADIAIFELKVAADLNEFVVPACIDTSHKYTLTNYSTGHVVGWGLDGIGKDRKPTKNLMKAELPYMDREQCIETNKKIFNISLKLTIDKFCAFHVKDGKPVVRAGDSGSGITFHQEGRYYVYGLVSVQANNKTTMFTNVTYPDHLEFINRVLNKILEHKKTIIKNDHLNGTFPIKTEL